jgi:hypothetical protein
MLLSLLVGLALAEPLPAQSAVSAGREVTLGLSFHDVSGRLGSAPGLEMGFRPGWHLSDRVRPDVGAMIAWDGAAYGFVGVYAPVPLPGGVMVSPSIGIGVYGAGDRTDLGSALEFRSALTVSFPRLTARPVAVSFYHLSNAGLRRPNPGVEVLAVSWTISR